MATPAPDDDDEQNQDLIRSPLSTPLGPDLFVCMLGTLSPDGKCRLKPWSEPCRLGKKGGEVGRSGDKLCSWSQLEPVKQGHGARAGPQATWRRVQPGDTRKMNGEKPKGQILEHGGTNSCCKAKSVVWLFVQSC